MLYRVKSGIFGQTAKLGQRPCLSHISNIGIKNKLPKQTVKILMRRLIRSRLIWIYTVCKCVSEFTRCQNLLDFTQPTCASICPLFSPDQELHYSSEIQNPLALGICKCKENDRNIKISLKSCQVIMLQTNTQ